MAEKNNYFEAIPGIGDLTLEHTFYEYDEPLLFVCVDDNAQKYFCSCYELALGWLICKVSHRQLVRLIDNELSLNGVFQENTESTFSLSWTDMAFQLSPVEADMYPRPEARLDLATEETLEYRDYLIKTTPKDIFLKIDSQIPVWYSYIEDISLFLERDLSLSLFHYPQNYLNVSILKRNELLNTGITPEAEIYKQKTDLPHANKKTAPHSLPNSINIDDDITSAA